MSDMRNAGIVFDLPLGGEGPVEEAKDLYSRNSRIRDAVNRAESLSENRMITQDVAHEIEEELPVEDRYAFHMALVDADLRVRTGGYTKRRAAPGGRILPVPPIDQSPGMCGPAALSAVLALFGVRKSEAELAALAGSTPDDGTPTENLVQTAKQLGFDAWSKDDASLDELQKLVQGGVPVIVDWFSSSDGHYSPVMGIDDNVVLLQDPEIAKPREMSRADFDNVWFDFDGDTPDGRLVKRRIIVVQPKRTAAVNVVDREEPVVRGMGDASVNSTNLWTTSPSMPRDELNTSPNGTAELDFGKPRRSEGEKHEGGGFGNNLTDLTVAASLTVADVVRTAQGYGEGAFAVSREEVLAMLNHALGLEYSQALRYNVYADTLRVAYRDALAEEFEDHADEETEHAKALSAKIVALGGSLAPKIEEPVRIPPNDPDLIGRILRELWKQEQEGIKFYRSLKKALGENVFVHYIEEVLVAESEHVDDLVRFTSVVKSAAAVPLPSYPARSEPARWGESYTDENQFEGTDKMGTSELGKCPHCESGEVLGQACEQCSGKTASVVRALCEQCDGFGFVKTCLLCGESWAPPPTLSVARIATWQRRAGNVQRKTMYGEIPVWIEYEAGDLKRGTSRTGETWERKMRTAYGFVPGTRGADGEPVDVYLGGNPSRKVYMVSQMAPGGGFDEEKAMLGFPNAQQAEAMYRSHMPNNGAKHFGGIREMSVGDFEGEYLRSDAASPYKPTLQLRQFSVTGQKMVPNPNPKGREDQVTEEYAEKWKAEHGQGGGAAAESEPDEGLSDVFQKAKQDKVKGKVQQALKGLDGAKTGDFVKGLAEKLGVEPQQAMRITQQLEQAGVLSKQVAVSDEGDKQVKREVVKIDPSKFKGMPAVSLGEPKPAPEPAQEAPAPAEPAQSPSVPAEPATAPAAPPAAVAPAAPAAPPVQKKPKKPVERAQKPAPVERVEQKPMSSVDTSKAVSPITQQDMRDSGKAKELEMQFWRLLGGPGFNPYKTSVLDLHRLASLVVAESYSQPDHGPLGTDGEPDHPTEENVVMHASRDEEWPFSVSAAVLLERVARGDLVKVQGPTGWIGLVSKETMAKEPGKYVPVTEKQEDAPATTTQSRPKKAEGLVQPATVARVREEAFIGPRNWTDDPPAGMPEETWMQHFDGHPWYGGKPNPERARMHEPIIAEFLDHVPPAAPGEPKLAIMTMGGPASGKTTMLQGIDRNNFVQVDPDDIKKRLPEYKQATNPDMTWRGAAKCVHKESTYIGDEIQDRAMRAGKHMIIDGTGADAESFEATMAKLRSHGYKIKLYMPDLDADEAINRMRVREQREGRYVPEDIVRNAYERVPQNFERLARQADDAFMFDARRSIPSADGKKRPRLVWSLGAKGEKQHDRKFIEQFRARTQQAEAQRALGQPAPAQPAQSSAA